MMINKKKYGRDLITSFGICIFVQCFYTWVFYKPSIVSSELDLYIFGVGLFLPYVLPFWVVYNEKHKIKEVD